MKGQNTWQARLETRACKRSVLLSPSAAQTGQTVLFKESPETEGEVSAAAAAEQNSHVPVSTSRTSQHEPKGLTNELRGFESRRTFTTAYFLRVLFPPDRGGEMGGKNRAKFGPKLQEQRFEGQFAIKFRCDLRMNVVVVVVLGVGHLRFVDEDSTVKDGDVSQYPRPP